MEPFRLNSPLSNTTQGVTSCFTRRWHNVPLFTLARTLKCDYGIVISSTNALVSEDLRLVFGGMLSLECGCIAPWTLDTTLTTSDVPTFGTATLTISKHITCASTDVDPSMN